MATYYCDADLTTGNNDGTTAANAWQTLQRAIDGTGGTQPTAGDIVLCKGTDSIAAAIDMDGLDGTYNGGYVKYIGVNASWENDGTQFVIDGQSNNINGLVYTASDYIWLENFKIHACDLDGQIKAASSSSNCVFENVWLHDGNGAYGAYINAAFINCLFNRCKFTSNTSGGVYRPSATTIFDSCRFEANAVGCSYATSPGVIRNSIFFNNTSDGLVLYGNALIENCVFDSNAGHGINQTLPAGVVDARGCRFTNHATAGKYGISAGSAARARLAHCYFGNNAAGAVTAGLYEILSINGSTAHVVLAGEETDHGYVTYDTETPSYDFNLDATKAANTRSFAVPIP